MPDKRLIVFVCEHGAAKSVIAAAYFNKFAIEKNLGLRAIARGTNPEAGLSVKAVAGLQKDGLVPNVQVPRRLSPADVQSVEKIISFGEPLKEFRHQIVIERWDDIPPVSEGYEKARDAILAKINQLLE